MRLCGRGLKRLAAWIILGVLVCAVCISLLNSGNDVIKISRHVNVLATRANVSSPLVTVVHTLDSTPGLYEDILFVQEDEDAFGYSPAHAYSADHVCMTPLCGSMFSLGYIDPATPTLVAATLTKLSCKDEGGLLYLEEAKPRERGIVSLYARQDLSGVGWGVVLVTQLRAERLATLWEVLDRWTGPVVATVYTYDLWSAYLCSLSHVRPGVLLLFVQGSEILYPINWLRNLGLVAARGTYPTHIKHMTSDSPYQVTGSHVFVTDVDFLPSAELYEHIMNHVSSALKAYVVPAFEMRRANMSLPYSKTQLQYMTSLGWAGPVPRARQLRPQADWLQALVQQ